MLNSNDRSKEISIQFMYDDLKRMTFSHRNVVKSNKYGLQFTQTEVGHVSFF